MNLKNVFKSENDIRLFKSANVILEDREYEKEEIKQILFKIEDFLMAFSMKNGDMRRAREEFSGVVDILSQYIIG